MRTVEHASISRRAVALFDLAARTTSSAVGCWGVCWGGSSGNPKTTRIAANLCSAVEADRLLDYVLTGELNVDHGEAEGVLAMARLIGADDAVRHCEQVIIRRTLTATHDDAWFNVERMLALAGDGGQEEVARRAELRAAVAAIALTRLSTYGKRTGGDRGPRPFCQTPPAWLRECRAELLDTFMKIVSARA